MRTFLEETQTKQTKRGNSLPSVRIRDRETQNLCQYGIPGKPRNTPNTRTLRASGAGLGFSRGSRGSLFKEFLREKKSSSSAFIPVICGQRSLLCLSFALQRWPQGFLATLAPKAFGVDRRKVFLSVKSLKSAVKSAPSFCIFHFAFPFICVHPRCNSLICRWPLFASPSHSIYTLSFILLRGQTISFHFYGTQAPRKRRLWRSPPF